MLGRALLWLVLGASPDPSAADCPGRDAIGAELQRLGTADAVARFGSPEVTVQGTKMRVALRAADGAVAGVREVAAPASCAERAQVAAVLMSAWVGAWSAGSFPEVPAAASPSTRASELAPVLPMRADSTPARAGNSVPMTVVAPAAPERPVRGAGASAPSKVLAPTPAPRPAAVAARAVKRAPPIDVSGFGGVVHDGDAGALGGGAQVGYRFPGWLGVDAAFAGHGERERSMPSGLPGTAAYHGYSLGVGLNLRRRLGWLLADLSLLPELTLLVVDGRNLSPGRSATRWGAATEARLRVGVSLGAWRPFFFAGGGYALRGERLTVDGHADQGIALSRWSFGLGAGLAYLIGQAK